MARLKDKYIAEVAPALMKKFEYKSVMQIPKIDKVVVNVGCGEARDNAKVLEAVARDLAAITGQKAIITNAKKSVANFKVREGMPVGAKVTLRSDKMWEFLDRLFNVALPRVRDFDLPRDRVRQDRQDPRHGYRDLHHRTDRRRGQGSSGAGWRPLRALRRNKKWRRSL